MGGCLGRLTDPDPRADSSRPVHPDGRLAGGSNQPLQGADWAGTTGTTGTTSKKRSLP